MCCSAAFVGGSLAAPLFPVPLRFSHEDERAQKFKRSTGALPRSGRRPGFGRAQNAHTHIRFPLAPSPATSQVEATTVCALLVHFRFAFFCFLRSESASYANRCLWWVNWLFRACVGPVLLLRQSLSPVTNFDHEDVPLAAS